MQVVKLLEKEPENALQPNLVTSTSVTSSTHMTSPVSVLQRYASLWRSECTFIQGLTGGHGSPTAVVSLVRVFHQ